MSSESLSREIRKWELVALLVNVTVGAGILKLPSDVQRSVGNYSLLAFIVCALIIGLIALCFAEVGSQFSGTGGPYLYAKETFGVAPAFLVGWLMWLTRLAGFATLVQVFVAYLGYFWPAAESGLPRTAVITTLVVVLTVINLVGVKQSARTSDVFTVSKLIPLLLFIIVGLLFINPARFTFTSAPTFGSFTSAVFVLVYVFSGFEAVLINSGEVRQPQRAIPFALIVALSGAVVLFLLIQIVCIGVLPDLANSQRPLADASYIFLGTAGPVIISLGALISIFGTLNVIMLACTRLPFAMAAQHQLPAPLARIHNRFRTPHISILTCAAAALLIALPGTFIYAVKITVITRVIVYASTCAALPILRRQAPVESSFKVSAGIPISIVCVALCVWLLLGSDWREARDVSIAIVVGLVVYGLTRMTSTSRFRRPMKPSADQDT
ncbi:MAG: APC family permease [Blastocatellia bacterium]|nr:MAG: APC family permease [Blastocatellia bacterium]